VTGNKPAATRVAQAALLLVGALCLELLVVPDDRRFYWTPLIVGLAYLAAAVSGGRTGGHWATACALTGWGAAVVLVGAVHPDLDTAGLYLAGAGLGTAAGVLIQRAGFEVSVLGLAVTVAVGGLVLAFTTRAPGVLEDARTYAVLLALVALVNLALAAREVLARRRSSVAS